MFKEAQILYLHVDIGDVNGDGVVDDKDKKNKKKGGKGLAVLTGRDLYSFKQDLFDKVEEEDKDGNAISIPASIAATSDTGSSSKVRADNSVDQIAHAVESELFLEGDDDDFDDIVDDE